MLQRLKKSRSSISKQLKTTFSCQYHINFFARKANSTTVTLLRLIILIFFASNYHHRMMITGVEGVRMVRLCIASVDPIKLSSQCVMCNRREFPLSAIDCTGISKMNDLISSPLTVQEATCLIYNCRRQIPDIRPEPYHGSVSQIVRPSHPAASGSRSHQTMTMPSSIGYSGTRSLSKFSPYGVSSINPFSTTANAGPELASSFDALASNPFMVGSHRQQQSQPLPYALVPAVQTFPFGFKRMRSALVPLFKR